MMMHQPVNFSFQDHLAFMEPEPETANLFPAPTTSPFPASPVTGYCPNPGSSKISMMEGCSSPMEAMREMMFRVAAMQPVRVDPEAVRPKKRRNVRISSDPQSVAARHRRERISERIRILQRLVPGGTKMDTASMLEEAVRYLKFLKREVKSLEEMAVAGGGGGGGGGGRQRWPGVGVGGCSGSWVGVGPYSIMHDSHVNVEELDGI